MPNYKKCALRIFIAALISCAALALCLLTKPKENYPPPPFGRSYGVESVVYADLIYSYTYTAETAPQYCLTADYVLLEKEAGKSEWNSLGSLEEERLSPLVFDSYFREQAGGIGWLEAPYGPEKLRLDNRSAWSLIVDNRLYYVLLQYNGDVYLAYGYYDPDIKYPDAQGSIRWLFKLADTSDAPLCTVRAGSFQSIKADWYPDGNFDFDYDSLPVLKASSADTLHIKTGWDCETLNLKQADRRGHFNILAGGLGMAGDKQRGMGSAVLN